MPASAAPRSLCACASSGSILRAASYSATASGMRPGIPREGNSLVVVGRRKGRVDPQRRVKLCDRLGKPAWNPRQGGSEVIVGDHVFGIDADRLLELGDGFLRSAAGVCRRMRPRGCCVHLRDGGVDPKRRLVLGDRQGNASRDVREGEAVVGVRTGASRGLRDGVLSRSLGRFGSPCSSRSRGTRSRSRPLQERRERGAPGSARQAQRTATLMIATSGRYIRCSAMGCPPSGTKLEVGERTMKNHAQAKPAAGQRRKGTGRDREERGENEGIGRDLGCVAGDLRAIVEDERVRPRRQLQVEHHGPDGGQRVLPGRKAVAISDFHGRRNRP